MDDGILCTIGYEKAALADVIAALHAGGVRRVIDVRALPLSRRAGFSKTALRASLVAEGIDYVHLRELGTPAAGREANRRRDWGAFWEIVDAGLATGEAQAALAEAGALAGNSRSCLLCYEEDPCICHRLRVAELLGARHGFVARHLTAGSVVT